MKKFILSLSILLVLCTIGCESFGKKETHKEISIEKKKINDTLIKATVTTKYKTGDKVTEEVQIIKGTHGEVNAQLEAYKMEILQEKGEKAVAHTKHTETKEIKKLQFALNPKSGSSANGMVSFTEEEGTVTLEAHINGLTPGIHAIHVHEKADCSSEDGKSSGGHWNPTFELHGAWGDEKGYHRGDIGNFNADETGHGMITFSTDLWCLGCDDDTKNLLGKAIIVHQGEDDLSSQPSGAAGARVSCAGLIQ